MILIFLEEGILQLSSDSRTDFKSLKKRQSEGRWVAAEGRDIDTMGPEGEKTQENGMQRA